MGLGWAGLAVEPWRRCAVSRAGARPASRWCLGLGLLGMVTLVAAQGVGASGVPLSITPAAFTPWLGRIQQAAATSNYQGTLMYSAGGVVSNSRVLQVCDGRQRYERIELLDGPARLQFRHNDQTLTLWPATRVARAEQRDPVAEFPALPAVASQRTLDNYEPQALTRDRMAGHDADVLLLKPRDKLRYAQRLWADRDTGLLLRNDVIGPGGELLETSAFTDVQIGAKVSPDAVLLPMKRLDGYRVLRSHAERTQVEAEGWTLVRPVPGFQLVSCTKRPLDPASDAGPQVPVLQSVFSDGLAHVSVFIEPFDAQRHSKTMGTSLGATHTLTSRQGDWWFTVVGEVPMATAQQFGAMFERKR